LTRDEARRMAVNFAKLPERLRGPPQNVTFTDAMRDSRDDSLRFMRERMFRDQKFEAGVFIGGMESILDEFDLHQAAA
jgi:SLOG cluster3 family